MPPIHHDETGVLRPDSVILDRRGLILALAACLGLPGCGRETPDEKVLRIGHFPNVTHAQGLVAHRLSRQERGWFEARLGGDVRIEWYVFNAGPSAMEALLAGTLDATYVGPNPVINAHLRTGGRDVRVLAGAAFGGSALVVRSGSGIASARDLKGRRLATPQLGNTQDVAARAWLAKSGFQVGQTGGDVAIVPTENPDQIALFQSGGLDAAWTVEPWVSRLEMEAGGMILVEEKDALTTLLACSEELLRTRPEVARKLVQAHRDLTDWILANPEDAKRLVSEELEAETHRPMPRPLLDRCWPRLVFESGIDAEDLDGFARRAKAVGLLDREADLSRLLARP